MNTTHIPADVVARLTARAQPMLADCIGAAKTIRIDAKTTQTGRIVGAAIDRIRQRGRSYEVVFVITMECGVAKVMREFRCLHLPV